MNSSWMKAMMDERVCLFCLFTPTEFLSTSDECRRLESVARIFYGSRRPPATAHFCAWKRPSDMSRGRAFLWTAPSQHVYRDLLNYYH